MSGRGDVDVVRVDLRCEERGRGVDVESRAAVGEELFVLESV